MLKEKSFLFFGHKGFLGSHLYNQICQNFIYSIEAVGRVVTDTYDIPTSKYEEFDFLIHCAQNYNDNEKQKKIDYKIVNFWQKHQSKATLVTFGTDALYAEDRPHSEEYYGMGLSVPRLLDYANTKRELLQSLQQGHEKKWHHFVLVSMFGPSFKVADEHLVHSIIKKVSTAKRLNTTFKVGNPKLLREISYVTDVAKNICSFMNQEAGLNQVINLGSSNKLVSIESLVKIICEIADYPFEMAEFDLTDTGTSIKYMDNSKAKSLLSDNYEDTPLYESIKTTYDWYHNFIGK
jgi:nucleoside-diphosphate-sugar epimerase